MSSAPGYRSEFRQVGEHRLFVAEHLPAQRRGAVLLISPFLEEMLFCRRVLRHLAIALASDGWHVMRFDRYGEGDSEGELANADVAGALADIDVLAKQLADAGEGPVVAVGWRWGANLAVSAASSFDGVVAVEPMETGEDYMQQLLRQNLTSQMAAWGKVRVNRDQLLALSAQRQTINIQGFELGHVLIKEIRQWSWPDQVDVPLAMVRSFSPGAQPAEKWQVRAASLSASLQQVPCRPYWFEPRYHDPFLPDVMPAVHAAIASVSVGLPA